MKEESKLDNVVWVVMLLALLVAHPIIFYALIWKAFTGAWLALGAAAWMAVGLYAALRLGRWSVTEELRQRAHKEAVDAWHESRRRVSKGPRYCQTHGGYGFISDCVECQG